MYFMPFGVTFAMTGVAPFLVAPCFNLPISFAEGDAGVPLREDLTCICHLVPVGKVTVKSAAPLLLGLCATVAPLALNDRVIFISLSIPYLY